MRPLPLEPGLPCLQPFVPISPSLPPAPAHSTRAYIHTHRAMQPRGGLPSTSADVLRQLAPLHPLPGLVLQHRALAKLRDGFLASLLRRAADLTAAARRDRDDGPACVVRRSALLPEVADAGVAAAAAADAAATQPRIRALPQPTQQQQQQASRQVGGHSVHIQCMASIVLQTERVLLLLLLLLMWR